MTIKKCDRCGETYNPYDEQEGEVYLRDCIRNDIDLCPSCHVDLNLWMRGRYTAIPRDKVPEGLETSDTGKEFGRES